MQQNIKEKKEIVTCDWNNINRKWKQTTRNDNNIIYKIGLLQKQKKDSEVETLQK